MGFLKRRAAPGIAGPKTFAVGAGDLIVARAEDGTILTGRVKGAVRSAVDRRWGTFRLVCIPDDAPEAARAKDGDDGKGAA
ncbi:MAG: hypothetical protein WAL04_18860 [Acidimicrobiales bacterium]